MYITYECYAKYGNKWSYKGVISANSPRQAAFQMQYIYNRNVWKIRPENSRDKFMIYKITSAPQVTS